MIGQSYLDKTVFTLIASPAQKTGSAQSHLRQKSESSCVERERGKMCGREEEREGSSKDVGWPGQKREDRKGQRRLSHMTFTRGGEGGPEGEDVGREVV